MNPTESQDYQMTFEFVQKTGELTIPLDRPQLTLTDVRRSKQARSGSKR